MKTPTLALLMMILPASPVNAVIPARTHAAAVHAARAQVAAFRFSARRTVVRPRAVSPVIAYAAVIRAPVYDTMLPGYTPVYPLPLYSDRAASPSEPIRVEQTAASAEPSASTWYYCPSSKAYYPGVRNCPEGWREAGPDPAAFIGSLRTN